MTGKELRQARKERDWTQSDLAKRLRVSQTYVALLERGSRPFPSRLARKATRVLAMNASTLPLSNRVSVDEESLARQLSAFGYPGFAYLRPARKRNPAEVLLAALGKDNLEARLVEALPWLLLQYGAMDESLKQWMVEQARARGLTNRLGFTVTLAREVAERKGDTTSVAYEFLQKLEQELYRTRLAEPDTLCQAHLSERQREWLQDASSDSAKRWNLLTNWRPEHLQYAN